MNEVRIKVKRHWEQELIRWEGLVIIPDGNIYKTGILRQSKKLALQDAERMKEELVYGQR